MYPRVSALRSAQRKRSNDIYADSYDTQPLVHRRYIRQRHRLTYIRSAGLLCQLPSVAAGCCK